MNSHPTGRRGGIPRGQSTNGPILFSYGFRPFFLAAGLMAIATMILWILALAGELEVGGSYGAQHWHAHEMLFGFAPAVVAGFLLTSIPNWTGRLPVSGRPLMALLALWLAGRLALLQPDLVSPVFSAAIDSLFLPVLFLVFAREIVTGRKWRDTKVLVILAILASANIAFHVLVLAGEHAGGIERLAVSAYVVLIMLRTKLSSTIKGAIAAVALVALMGMFIFDPKFWGVVLMGVSVMILAPLPWLDHSPVKSIRYRPTWHKYVDVVFGIAFLILGYLGVLPPTAGRTLVSQICTFIYCGFFLLMPWWGAMGKFKPVPSRVTFHPH